MKTDSISETKSGQPLEEDLPHPPERQVEAGVAGPQGQKRPHGPRVVQPRPGLHQDVTHHDAEPAKLDHDRLGSQLPPRSFGRLGCHRLANSGVMLKCLRRISSPSRLASPLVPIDAGFSKSLCRQPMKTNVDLSQIAPPNAPP